MRKGNGGDTGRNDEHKGVNVAKGNQILSKTTSTSLSYKFAFIEVERNGIKTGRCVAPVDSDWRLLALTRRGNEKMTVDIDDDFLFKLTHEC